MLTVMKCTITKLIIIGVMLAILAGVIVGITLLVLRSDDDGDSNSPSPSPSPSSSYSFPKDFKIGAASASYQIEGAWDEG